jgi:hypothetical protein
MGIGTETRREGIGTGGDIRAELYENGYANLAFGLGKSAVAELFANFKNFATICDEPGGEKLVEALNFKVGNKGNGIFYMKHRKPGDVNDYEKRGDVGKDDKLVMHFGAQTHSRALDVLGVLPKEMEIFLDNCAQFYMEGRRVAQIGARALGIEDPLFPSNHKKDIHLLRLIDYTATNSEHLGEAHFDRGVVTLAISESAPGLRGKPGDNGFLKPLDEAVRQRLQRGLDPINHQEGVAKFFASAGLRRLPPATREGQDLDAIPLLAHDIVNENPGEDRQAVVMFFNPYLGFEPYTVPEKEETSVSY